ncbi:hypothetical protein H4219_000331 [Mycoemilia scoparia]|uniref:Uncharacterized protein n=1 Tax=Mycoemilia scoparia TaxID=417184 RepID=A0A9W8DX57_9FUNG|nr:hypothetical protein H4219_000331 [Mycoemilia scoparia]
MDGDKGSLDIPPPPYSTVVSNTSPTKSRILNSCPPQMENYLHHGRQQRQSHQTQQQPRNTLIGRPGIGQSGGLDFEDSHHSRDMAFPDIAHIEAQLLGSSGSLLGSHMSSSTQPFADNIIYSKMNYLEHIVSRVKSTLDSQADAYKSVASQIAELNQRMANANFGSSSPTPANNQNVKTDSIMASWNNIQQQMGPISVPERPYMSHNAEAGKSDDANKDDEDDVHLDRLSEMIDSLIKDASNALSTSPSLLGDTPKPGAETSMVTETVNPKADFPRQKPFTTSTLNKDNNPKGRADSFTSDSSADGEAPEPSCLSPDFGADYSETSSTRPRRSSSVKRGHGIRSRIRRRSSISSTTMAGHDSGRPLSPLNNSSSNDVPPGFGRSPIPIITEQPDVVFASQLSPCGSPNDGEKTPIVAPVKITEATPPPSTRARSNSLVLRVRDKVTRGILQSATLVDKSVNEDIKIHKMSRRDVSGSENRPPVTSPFSGPSATNSLHNSCGESMVYSPEMNPKHRYSKSISATLPRSHRIMRSGDHFTDTNAMSSPSSRQVYRQFIGGRGGSVYGVRKPRHRRTHNSQYSHPFFDDENVVGSVNSGAESSPCFNHRESDTEGGDESNFSGRRSYKPRSKNSSRIPHSLHINTSTLPRIRGRLSDSFRNDGFDFAGPVTAPLSPNNRNWGHTYNLDSSSRNCNDDEMSLRSSIPDKLHMHNDYDNDDDPENRHYDSNSDSRMHGQSRTSFELTRWRPSLDNDLDEAPEENGEAYSHNTVVTASDDPEPSSASIISFFTLFYWMMLFSLGVCMLDSFLCNVAGQRVLGTMEKITANKDDDGEVKDDDESSEGSHLIGHHQTGEYVNYQAQNKGSETSAIAGTMGRLVRWYVEDDEVTEISNPSQVRHQPHQISAIPQPISHRHNRKPQQQQDYDDEGTEMPQPGFTSVFSTSNIRERRRRVLSRGRPHFKPID